MKKLGLIIGFILLFQSTLSAETTILLNDTSLFKFANKLYQSKEYYRAISEYKRLIHYFPESAYIEKARFNIGKSFMAGGERLAAVKYWKKLLEDPSSSEIETQIRWHLGISYLDMDMEKPYLLRQEYIEQGMEQFRILKQMNPELTPLYKQWKAMPPPSEKSPLLAGMLSAVIPGSGSLYTNRPQEAFYSFFITGMFYLAALEAYREEDKPLATVFGFFSITFYGGNIYTAINSAHKYNDLQASEQLNKLREQKKIWFRPDLPTQ